MHPAFAQMLNFNKSNPESKDVYKKMQAWHISHKSHAHQNELNQGVFCPLIDTMTFSQKVALAYMSNKFTPDTLLYAQNLNLYGTWRNSLGIYKIDDDMIEDVTKSLIPADTPVSIFSRLPEFCVYMDIQNAQVSVEHAPLLGFWAMLDVAENVRTGEPIGILRLVFHIAGMENMHTEIEMVIDDETTVEQAIISMYRQHYEFDEQSLDALLNSDFTIARLVLSCLLWLCAEEPDISFITGEPVSKEQLKQPRHSVNKKTGTFVVPNEPFHYDIGKRLGGEIRMFNERIHEYDKETSSSPSSKKRPHIRRGHWHGHWRGTGQAKEFFVKWQPAIFING